MQKQEPMFGHTTSLIIEMVLNSIGGVLGVILLTRAQDNLHKRLWGIMVIVLSISLMGDNVAWFFQFYGNTLQGYAHANLISISIILQWYVFSPP